MVIKKSAALPTQLGIACGKLLRSCREAFLDNNGSTGFMGTVGLNDMLNERLGHRAKN